jgi:muramoyltetrapeptide carboxypeptidase
MNLIKPKKLKSGDTIAIIATSGEVDMVKILNAKKFFEKQGYKVKLGSNIEKKDKYLAGKDGERLKDLHDAFLDNSVNAIICARGGYGAIRLTNKINYELIKNNPKIFCGYSDVTAISAMLLRKSNLITFSAPMAQGDFGDDKIDELTVQAFFNTLTSSDITLCPTKEISYNTKNCQGILFGGNLTTLTSLCGQDFIPDEKFIFFVEDVNEPVYKIDRAFTQLLNIEKFKNNLAGIILGEFSNVDNEQWLNSFFENLSQKLDIPIFGEYKITHEKSKLTVPYGAFAVVKENCIHISNYLSE